MILVATGLRQELNILEGSGVFVVAGGGDGTRLERELEAAAGDAEAVISMGLCGALSESLKPGDWVIGTRVLTPLIPEDQQVYETDPDWVAALLRAFPRARSGPVLGSDAMIADAGAKRAVNASTGAIAVDMESHIAGAVAARHGLPFAVARVVSDAADRSLPKAAQAGMAADGRMDIGAVLKALAADPRQLPALIRVGAEAGTAFRMLRRGRDFLGPGLGRLDLGKHLIDMA
jgi:adenosylhomocysteine nucleosidase